MNKELTPLQALEQLKGGYKNEDLVAITRSAFEKNIDIIETALKENKKLKKLYKAELNNTAYYNNLALKYKRALEIFKRNCLLSQYPDGTYELAFTSKIQPTEEDIAILKEVLNSD